MQQMKKHATCKICYQRMAPHTNCTAETVTCNQTIFYRIPAGAMLDADPDMGDGEACHGCNVGKGQYHHFNCAAERCPCCHEQLIRCACEVAFEDYVINLAELVVL